jgi:hypothetical protein
MNTNFNISHTAYHTHAESNVSSHNSIKPQQTQEHQVLEITVHQKFIIHKNEHARYTLEYFPVDNARIFYTKGLNS